MIDIVILDRFTCMSPQLHTAPGDLLAEPIFPITSI